MYTEAEVRILSIAAAATACLVLVGSAGAGSAGVLRHGPILGLVPIEHNGKAVPSPFGPRPGVSAVLPSPFDPTMDDVMSFQGGSVFRTSTVYTIFWAPAGYAFPTGYESVINKYFQDVAADSGSSTNVYSILPQYYDNTGSIAYDSTFGGTFDDTQTYPASGCTLPNSIDNAASLQCLSDDQLSAEVKRVADAQGWPNGANVEFFMYTPHNVGSCVDFGDGLECSYSSYCAYHSSMTDVASNTYFYANEPYPNQSRGGGAEPTDCDMGEHPNAVDPFNLDDSAADEDISSSSHEYSETITDPLGTGWWVSDPLSFYYGYEIGDLCAYYLGGAVTVLGGDVFSGTAYDQVINGDHYFTQGEWSNVSATDQGFSGCVSQATPFISGSALVGSSLTGSAGLWSGSPTAYTYTWQRCDELGQNCQPIAVKKLAQTSTTYNIQRADYGKTIGLQVVAWYGSTASAPVAARVTEAVAGKPIDNAIPSITGPPEVGLALTGSVGGWSPSSSAITSYSYSWLRCDDAGLNCMKQKSGTTMSTDSLSYALTPADDKHTIVLQVSATNAVGTSALVESDPTDVISGEPEGGSPAVNGAAVVGHTLTADVDPLGWSFTPTWFKVTWTRTVNAKTTTLRTATVRLGGAAPAYALVAADDKATIGIVVTASNAAGASDPASASTGPVTGEPVATVDPVVSGTPQVGQPLTAGAGSWSPAATRYTYEWLRCDGGGANCHVVATVTTTRTSVTRRPVGADHGKTYRVRVTASNSAGASLPDTSAATSVIP